MGCVDSFPLVLDREGVQRLLNEHVDPDAERFRYFGAVLMGWAADPQHETPAARTLRRIMDNHKPATLDELRACVDAAKRLTP